MSKEDTIKRFLSQKEDKNILLEELVSVAHIINNQILMVPIQERHQTPRPKAYLYLGKLCTPLGPGSQGPFKQSPR